MRTLLLIIISTIGIISCNNHPSGQKSVIGIWDNQSGQILNFQPNGKALWIFYSESQRDTFEIKYLTDFSKEPFQLDLTDFKAGPLQGKTLYGIMEFSDTNTIKLDFEPSMENRPKAFDPKQTQTYYKQQ
jgi:uncharacterized protein (TIGR03067 family)